MSHLGILNMQSFVGVHIIVNEYAHTCPKPPITESRNIGIPAFRLYLPKLDILGSRSFLE